MMAKKDAEKKKPSHICVKIPIGSDDESAYLQMHVEMRLNYEQAVALRRLYRALHGNAEKVEQDRYVQRSIDAIRWLLEQYGRRIPAAS